MLVQKKAPNFKAKAIMPNNSISEDFDLYNHLGKDYGILFFYPLNFTFVCPTELLELNKKISQFVDAKVIAISVDSEYSHLAWKNTKIIDGGIEKLNYPLVSDLKKEITELYGVQSLEKDVALRATVIIDPDKIVRHYSVNDLFIGRNIDEIIRLLNAAKHGLKTGSACPAQWNPDKESIKTNSESIKSYLSRNYQ